MFFQGILHDKLTYMQDFKTGFITCLVNPEDFID